MLTINNLHKIMRYPINNTFHVRCMICGHMVYHISLTDVNNGQHRDLKLNRMKGRRGKYTISHGNYSLYLKFSDIQNIDTFCAQLKRLIC
jgi:hypothetical protein